MDQHRRNPGTEAGPEQAAEPRSLAVYEAELVPAAVSTDSPVAASDGVASEGPVAAATSTEHPAERVSAAEPASAYRDGFTGSLALHGVEVLDDEAAGAVLSHLDHLIRWAQAQQAKVLHRIETVYREDIRSATGKLDPKLAFSLAASEAATILQLPYNTGKRLMVEAGTLCQTHAATLAKLQDGGISYGHVQTALEQSVGVPGPALSAFEAKLLEMADGQTRPQFAIRARRLREKQYPETIVERQNIAFEQRKVCLEPGQDGMSWLSALLPAEKAQVIFTQLCQAARGEQAAGDPRTVDQLRADILQDLLLNGGYTCGGETSEEEARSPKRSGTTEGSGTTCAGGGLKARGEILVLITAETLFGADDQPAELHGYGPISPQTARRMAREAAKWTLVEREPDTEEILRVGRRRKVPSGLKRWLRARDGTCRFPGCRSNAVICEIDHTKPWAQGGATDHDNLEHLCRRHHMFKTEGFWKARQPEPGIIAWTSPGGRTYRTEPHFSLASDASDASDAEQPPGPPHRVQPHFPIPNVPESDGPDDYGADPPPF
ncbi:HNH endonuclease signature motif containing protein [Arthrobacter sp. Z1-15]